MLYLPENSLDYSFQGKGDDSMSNEMLVAVISLAATMFGLGYMLGQNRHR